MRFLLALALVLTLAASSVSAQTRTGAPVPRYDMSIDLRAADGRVRVEGELRIPARDTPTPEISLSVNRAFTDVQFTVLGNPVQATAIGGYTDYLLRPAQPFPAHREIVVGFSYTFDPATRVYYFYSGADGAFASGINVAWYPQVVGQAPDGVGRLRVLTPPGFSVVVNGIQSASARIRDGRNARFRFRAPTAFSFAAGPFTTYRGDGAAPVRVLSLRPRAHAPMYANNVQRLIAFYGDLFVPFPYRSFAIVEVPEAAATRSGFSGQSENGMIFVTSRYLSRHFSWAYYGHEVGHQWWGQLLRKDMESQSGFYMPDEAVAQWGALQAVEHFEGAASAERFRRTGYPFYVMMQNGLGYLSAVAADQDEALDAPRGSQSHQSANSKGFLVLDHLADAMGRERFANALRTYLRAHANGAGSWTQLKEAFAAEAPDIMTWFAPQWFARRGAPDWSLRWSQRGGEVTGAITQATPFYRAMLDVELRGSCGARTERVLVDGAETPFRFTADCALEDVLLDPHYRVLRWTPEYRALARAQAPLARWRAADEYPQLGEEVAQALRAAPADDRYGVVFALNASLGRAYAYERRWPEAVQAWTAAINAPVIPPNERAPAYAALARALREAGDREGVAAAVARAIEEDARTIPPTGAAERARDVEAGD